MQTRGVNALLKKVGRKYTGNLENPTSWPVLTFSKQDKAVHFQDQNKGVYKLLLGQDLSKNNGSKRYLLVKEDFWFKNIANREHGGDVDMAFYEILRCEVPCKLYIDTDGAPDMDVAEFRKFISDLGKWLSKRLKKRIAYPVVLEASNKKKRSFHIIFNDVVCAGTYSCRALLEERFPKHKFIDPNAYHSRQLLRLVNSSKKGQQRPFKIARNPSKDIYQCYATIFDENVNVDYDKQPENTIDSFLEKREQVNGNGGTGYSRNEKSKWETEQAQDCKKEIKRKYPQVTFIGGNRYGDKLVYCKAKNIVCKNIGRAHRNNLSFITIRLKDPNKFHVGCNLPGVIIRCADEDCKMDAIIERFNVF